MTFIALKCSITKNKLRMQLDFTLSIYRELLNSLMQNGYDFVRFDQYNEKYELPGKQVILRHDVDRIPVNALIMAKIEKELEIEACYYFRSTKSVFITDIIKEISSLGHEIGYHYENLSRFKGDKKKAINNFCEDLEKFKTIAEIKTICMHGSPLSRTDNRAIWKSFNYHDYGINLEPYFDVDYSKYFYITDTGRKWNSDEVNVRDKLMDIKTSVTMNALTNISFKSSSDIIDLIHQNRMPDKLIINTHPHRWFRPGLGWIKEYIGQNIKNLGKRVVVKLNS